MKKSQAMGCGGIGCLVLLGGTVLIFLFLVIFAGAATAMVTDPVGSVIGWLTGNGPPDPGHVPAQDAPAGVELYTVTPIPALCNVTPTPVMVTATPDAGQPTPTPPGTYAGIPIGLPTATPCPTPYSHLNTPNPKWTPLPGGSGPHGWPLAGAGPGNITQNFGCTDYPVEPVDYSCSPLNHFHWGLDLSNAGGSGCGTTVYSTLTGTVSYASSGFSQWQGGNPYPYQGYGNVVGIVASAGNTNWRTVYAHLCQPYASVGEQVQAGQPIGLEGSTGMSGGTHVHYEVWVNGVLRDPIPYLNR